MNDKEIVILINGAVGCGKTDVGITLRDGLDLRGYNNFNSPGLEKEIRLGLKGMATSIYSFHETKFLLSEHRLDRYINLDPAIPNVAPLYNVRPKPPVVEDMITISVIGPIYSGKSTLMADLQNILDEAMQLTENNLLDVQVVLTKPLEHQNRLVGADLDHLHNTKITFLEANVNRAAVLPWNQ